MYQQPFYHHHHITSSASHGTLRPHCSTFVGPQPPLQPQQQQQPSNGKNQSLTLSASMLSNGNSCKVAAGSKSDYVPLRSSADNLLKQHQIVSIFLNTLKKMMNNGNLMHSNELTVFKDKFLVYNVCHIS